MFTERHPRLKDQPGGPRITGQSSSASPGTVTSWTAPENPVHRCGHDPTRGTEGTWLHPGQPRPLHRRYTPTSAPVTHTAPKVADNNGTRPAPSRPSSAQTIDRTQEALACAGRSAPAYSVQHPTFGVYLALGAAVAHAQTGSNSICTTSSGGYGEPTADQRECYRGLLPLV